MYLPQDIDIYRAALAGSIGGMIASRVVSNPTATSYAAQYAVAQAFAQELDTIWAGANSTDFDHAAVEDACFGVWSGRAAIGSPANNPTNWATTCTAIVAAVQEGDVNFVTQGIIIPPLAMTGSTPGLGAGETVELTPFLILTDNNAYDIEYDVIATGIDSVAGRVAATIIRNRMTVHKAGGITTVSSLGVTASSGDGAASGVWSVTASIAAAPDRVELLFSTGAATAAVKLTANINVNAQAF